MKIICKPRRAGKTTHIIHLAAEHDSYIVCISRSECERVAAQAESIGVNIRFPVTMEEFISWQQQAREAKSFIIDNIDAIISKMAKGTPVIAISASCQSS